MRIFIIESHLPNYGRQSYFYDAGFIFQCPYLYASRKTRQIQKNPGMDFVGSYTLAVCFTLLGQLIYPNCLTVVLIITTDESYFNDPADLFFAIGAAANRA